MLFLHLKEQREQRTMIGYLKSKWRTNKSTIKSLTIIISFILFIGIIIGSTSFMSMQSTTRNLQAGHPSVQPTSQLPGAGWKKGDGNDDIRDLLLQVLILEAQRKISAASASPPPNQLSAEEDQSLTSTTVAPQAGESATVTSVDSDSVVPHFLGMLNHLHRANLRFKANRNPKNRKERDQARQEVNDFTFDGTMTPTQAAELLADQSVMEAFEKIRKSSS